MKLTKSFLDLVLEELRNEVITKSRFLVEVGILNLNLMYQIPDSNAKVLFEKEDHRLDINQLQDDYILFTITTKSNGRFPQLLIYYNYRYLYLDMEYINDSKLLSFVLVYLDNLKTKSIADNLILSPF